MPVRGQGSSKKTSLQKPLAEPVREIRPTTGAREAGTPISEEREELLQLARRVPDEDLRAAKRLLQALIVDPLWLSIQTAPVEDEELSESCIESLRRGREELDRGETVSHEDVKREFGL